MHIARTECAFISECPLQEEGLLFPCRKLFIYTISVEQHAYTKEEDRIWYVPQHDLAYQFRGVPVCILLLDHWDICAVVATSRLYPCRLLMPETQVNYGRIDKNTSEKICYLYPIVCSGDPESPILG